MKRVAKKQDHKKKNAPSKKVSIKDYAQTLADIKNRIQNAQVKATMSANRELIELYWEIGEIINEKQEKNGWGSSTIEKLAKDVQNLFPGMRGFSRANLFYMKAFYHAYEKVQKPSGQLEDLPIFNIPWWHNVILLTKLKDNAERFWYAQKAIENGWSGNVLEMRIQSKIYQREGKAITNFSQTLPKPHSDMAHRTLKDPYLFDFLEHSDEYLEKEIEQGLIDHIQKFLLELGQGFAFVGRQVHLYVGDTDYYIDLLFYHFKLRCFIVVELKAGKFDPRDAGQINFYLSAIDDSLRSPHDNPTIGLILCRSKNNVSVEYALRRSASPIGVASYETQISENLPKELKGSLPSIKDLEEEFDKQEILQQKKSPKKTKK